VKTTNTFMTVEYFANHISIQMNIYNINLNIYTCILSVQSKIAHSKFDREYSIKMYRRHTTCKVVGLSQSYKSAQNVIIFRPTTRARIYFPVRLEHKILHYPYIEVK
jgi:hypothetical protein